jgi:ribosomal protein L32
VGEVLFWTIGGLGVLVGTAILLLLGQRLAPSVRRTTKRRESGRARDTRRERRRRNTPAAKICPACGSRYALEHRLCARDRSELSLLN